MTPVPDWFTNDRQFCEKGYPCLVCERQVKVRIDGPGFGWDFWARFYSIPQQPKELHHALHLSHSYMMTWLAR